MEITLEFQPTIELNTSLQVGDTIWYVEMQSAGGYSTANLLNASNNQNITKLGMVENISNEYLRPIVKVSQYHYTSQIPPLPNIDQNTFIMFSKNNKANLTSLTGYFAEASFVNNSKEKIELFAVASEIVESSK